MFLAPNLSLNMTFIRENCYTGRYIVLLTKLKTSKSLGLNNYGKSWYQPKVHEYSVKYQDLQSVTKIVYFLALHLFEMKMNVLITEQTLPYFTYSAVQIFVHFLLLDSEFHKIYWQIHCKFQILWKSGGPYIFNFLTHEHFPDFFLTEVTYSKLLNTQEEKYTRRCSYNSLK